jgi:thiamine-phosphate pyrophosphorylase
VVYRAFGDPDALAAGRRLVGAARRADVMLLAGADAGLAARIGADGVHLPERLAHRAAALRRARPRWLVTCAAHSTAALAAARRAGADAAVLSPVFASASPSAARPLGALRFAALVTGARLPVYALGGINRRTSRLLIRSGAAGLAAVESLSGPPIST